MMSQPVEGYYVSPLQRRLWFLQEAERTFNYNAHATVLLEGDLNLDRLKGAVKAVVSHHEALRTSFQKLPGNSIPFQVVGENVCEIEEIDLALNSRHAASDLSNGGLDSFPSGGSALKCRLVRSNDANHTLLLSVSSLCADAGQSPYKGLPVITLQAVD
jgi:surfactin family lipopeptide synthetase B